MANNAFEYRLEPEMEILDEDRLLVRAARHDTDAAGQLFDKYYDAVFGYIYHCTFDHALTEDLTSNVFLAAFRHLGRFQWRQIPFRAWLYRIATNEVRMHYRRANAFESSVWKPIATNRTRHRPPVTTRQRRKNIACCTRPCWS